jgi:hypothetical protein
MPKRGVEPAGLPWSGALRLGLDIIAPPIDDDADHHSSPPPFPPRINTGKAAFSSIHPAQGGGEGAARRVCVLERSVAVVLLVLISQRRACEAEGEGGGQ